MKKAMVCCPNCKSWETYWETSKFLACWSCGSQFKEIKLYDSTTWPSSNESERYSINNLEKMGMIDDTISRHVAAFEDNLIGSPEMTELLIKVFEDGPTLKDSGARRQFESGAVRDISEGKGRCDLMPLDVIGDLLDAAPLKWIDAFKTTKDIYDLEQAIQAAVVDEEIVDGTIITKCICTAMLETSKHFETGALKYGENNWKKGIPLHCYLDSAVRHYLKHLRGDTDEPHDRAFVWNLLCAIWTFEHKPELDDVEKNLVKEPEVVDLATALKQQLDIQSPSRKLYGGEEK